MPRLTMVIPHLLADAKIVDDPLALPSLLALLEGGSSQPVYY